MLNSVELPYRTDGFTWSICPISGSLVRSHSRGKIKESIPYKVAEALAYCDNPYLCSSFSADYDCLDIPKATLKKLNRMHRVLLAISNKHFFLSRLYANLHKNMFIDTKDAMTAISKLPMHREYSHLLCLQRTLLAAKTSKSFKAKGVLFIGAFLPTADMHAWIIEDGFQPDENDRDWINFRPMLALYYG